MSLATRPCKSVSSWCCKQTPIPTQTPTPTITPTPKITLFADVCTNPQADINGDLLVNVYMDSIIGSFGGSQVIVDTNVDVYITIYGDTTNDISGIVTVPSGSSYGSAIYPNFVPSENIVNITIDLVTPGSSSTQFYLPGQITYSGGCGLPPSPTPTPTYTNTPTPTVTITPTTVCCYQYEITNYYTTTKTIYYIDCDGVSQQVEATGNGLQTYINCAREGSITFSGVLCDNTNVDCISVQQANTPCGGCVGVTPTPTNTLTNTPTPTQTPTVTLTSSTIVSYLFCMGYDSTNCATACSDYSNCNP